jgi:hypothetical protein
MAGNGRPSPSSGGRFLQLGKFSLTLEGSHHGCPASLLVLRCSIESGLT